MVRTAAEEGGKRSIGAGGEGKEEAVYWGRGLRKRVEGGEPVNKRDGVARAAFMSGQRKNDGEINPPL